MRFQLGNETFYSDRTVDDLCIVQIFKSFFEIDRTVLDPFFKAKSIRCRSKNDISRKSRYGIGYCVKDDVTVTVGDDRAVCCPDL